MICGCATGTFSQVAEGDVATRAAGAEVSEAATPLGVETRRKLIETAVRHFAQDGFQAASQRAIQREAGVNPASAHYHFGSKEAMYRAVIDTFIHDVQQERIRRHRAIPADLAGAARLHRLLSDYFEPGYTVAATPFGLHYARILARVQGERGSPTQKIFNEIVGPVRTLYLDSLQALFPDASRDDLEEALILGVALMAIGAIGRGGEGNPKAVQSPKAEADRLATFLAPGFQARFGPPSDATSHQS